MRIQALFLLLLGLILLSGCSTPLLKLPCYDLPSTPEKCAGEASDPGAAKIEIEWSCSDCFGVRQGTAPLSVDFWLKGIQADPNEPVLWEIHGLNSNFQDRDFSKPNEKYHYAFQNQDTFQIQASYKDQKIEPVEFRVDVNEVSAKWSTPWQVGESCDARIHFLGDPENDKEVPYWIEVIIKADGLENVSVVDRVPYRVKFPEYTQSWRITPQKSVEPYRFPAQLDPQVIEFDGSGRRNLVWDVLIKCISPNGVEEHQITTRV